MNKLIFLLIPIFIITIIGCGGSSNSSSSTSSATLTWDAPTTNADGTALTDLAGYKIYYGPATNDYSGGSIDVGLTTSYDAQALPSGWTCFVVTAYDTSGNESTYSNEVCKNI